MRKNSTNPIFDILKNLSQRKKKLKNLKNLVAEFESRLKKEINNDSVSQDLRKEMKQKSDELERVMLAQTRLIQQFNQSQEQVVELGTSVCYPEPSPIPCYRNLSTEPLTVSAGLPQATD